MKLENIVLTSLRSPFLDDDKVYPPLALLYLKSAVEAQIPGINVDIMDGEPNDIEIFRDYDAVGVSVMTPQREQSKKLLWNMKKSFPDKKMIIGGPHALHYLEEIEREPWDFIVTHDGERALPWIIDGKSDGLRIIKDIMSKEQLASMPRPDRISAKAREMLSNYHYILEGRVGTSAFFARGCPEFCEFCEDARTAVRWSSMENIRGELDDIKSLGYGGVYIFDDLFAIAMPKIKPICEELQKRGLVYRCNAQARYFTMWGEEMAKLLSSTGCVEIAFGAESGSQKILDNIHKRTTVEQNYKTVEYAKRHGIKVKAFILLGLPGENWETLKETERFIRDSGLDDFQCAVYMPFKGTEIRRKLDTGESVDLHMTVPMESGAYGVKGGETKYEVGTSVLTPQDLQQFRNYLVNTYRPKAHKKKWHGGEDHFFEIARAKEKDYYE